MMNVQVYTIKIFFIVKIINIRFSLHEEQCVSFFSTPLFFFISCKCNLLHHQFTLECSTQLSSVTDCKFVLFCASDRDKQITCNIVIMEKKRDLRIIPKSAMNYQIIDKRNIIISSNRHDLPSNNFVCYLALN